MAEDAEPRRLETLLPHGDGPAVTDADGTTDAAALRALVDERVTALRAAGVGPGTGVGVALPDGVALVATLFAVWRAGGVYAPVNPRLTGTERARLLDAVAPSVVVTADDRGEAGITPRPGGVVRDPGLALIQTTSGTTGEPKAVLLTHDGVLELLDGVVGSLRGSTTATSGSTPPPAPMPNLIPVSLSLWAGIYNVLFAFRVGAPVVVLSPFDTRRFAAAVRTHAIRSTVLPPAAMTMLADDPGIEDLAPLRWVRSITAPLSPAQARRFHDRFGVGILNSYGQTEIGGEIIGWTAADWRAHGPAKLGAVGRPHRGVDVRTDAGTGELQVRTPALAAGYATGGDLADRCTTDGWFRTGDMGHVDDDGFVWIDGRLSDMVNRGGLKVFPGEVEEALRAAPGVADVAVVGVADERLGEVPWAFVVPEVTSGPLDPDVLDAFCREVLAPYKVPARFVPVDELPRNEVGKVLAGALRTRAASIEEDRT